MHLGHMALLGGDPRGRFSRLFAGRGFYTVQQDEVVRARNACEDVDKILS
jgi:hypothetical protein